MLPFSTLLRLLLFFFSRQMSGFESRPFCVVSVVDKVGLGQFSFFHYAGFQPSV